MIDVAQDSSTKPSSHYLWVKPVGRCYEVLSATIAQLARELGAPVFEPHVTLAGPVEGSEAQLLENCERLRRLLSQFDIVLDEPLHGADYFRCVFMRAEPNPDIMSAHETARRIFHLQERPYMPHLSLVYGTYPEAIRRRIVNTLSPDLRLSFRAQSFELIRVTSPDPRDWHTVQSFPFAEALSA